MPSGGNLLNAQEANLLTGKLKRFLATGELLYNPPLTGPPMDS